MLLFLLPTLSFGQDLRDWILKYEEYCETPHLDSIYQYGTFDIEAKQIEWGPIKCPEYHIDLKDVKLLDVPYQDINGRMYIQVRRKYPCWVKLKVDYTQDFFQFVKNGGKL